MRNTCHVMSLLASLILLSVGANGSPFVESFASDGVLGTGREAGYQAGDNWVVDVGVANSALYYQAGTGAIRIGYDHTTSVGPLDGPPHIVASVRILGAGTYAARFLTYRPKLMFGYQDKDNHYSVVINRGYRMTTYSGGGQFAIVLGVVVNGQETVLAGVDSIGGVAEAVGDLAAITVDWNPDESLITVHAEWTDATQETTKFTGQAFQITDMNAHFESGKLALGTATSVLTEVDWAAFTPPPPPPGTIMQIR